MPTYKSQMTGRTCLYRLRDIDGRLLYVGITRNPDGRFSKHAVRQPWWPDVAGQFLEWFATRDEAMAAEKRVIRDELPVHNIARPKVWC